MVYTNAKVLVVGVARSGIPTIKALFLEGAVITINDIKEEEALSEVISEIEGFYHDSILGRHPEDMGIFDLIVVSPGVPLDLPFIVSAKAMGIKVIGELEVAYTLAKGRFVGITGTNGKTTTTALVGEIFSKYTDNYFVVGNIGTAAVSRAKEGNEETTYVTEVSSFQLESIDLFKVGVGALLNVTPDHLNRHKTMENYIDAKMRLFENQSGDDIAVFNYDCAISRKAAERVISKVMFFSRKEALSSGAFLKEGMIVVKDSEEMVVCPISDIKIPGDHNVENVLAATLISYGAGIPVESIAEGIRSFGGFEHRLELVDEIDEILYFNDSKATNVDSTIKAIEAMTRPTVLIAGGMDKKVSFDALLEAFGGKIKDFILYGETKYMLKETAQSHGFNSNYIVEDLDEAVKLAEVLAKRGDTILLSPACASWDMYESYEHRGKHFKDLVRGIREAR